MKQPVIEEVYIDNMLQRVNYLSKVIHKDKKGRFVNVYNKKYYLVKWKGYDKKQSTWEPEEQLIEDGLQAYIDECYMCYNRACCFQE